MPSSSCIFAEGKRGGDKQYPHNEWGQFWYGTEGRGGILCATNPIPEYCLAKPSSWQVEDSLRKSSRAALTNDWLILCHEDLTELDLAEKTGRITDEDYDTVSPVVAEGLHEVIDLESSGRIKVGEQVPRAGYFIDQTTREELDTRGVDPTPTNPAPSGSTSTNPAPSNNSNSSNNSGGAENRPRNLFYGDDISLSAVKMDLSTKGAICAIAQYAWNLRLKSMHQFYQVVTRLHRQSMYRSFLQCI